MMKFEVQWIIYSSAVVLEKQAISKYKNIQKRKVYLNSLRGKREGWSEISRETF